MRETRRLPDDPISVVGIVVAAGIHLWSLHVVLSRLTNGDWPLDSWVRLLPGGKGPGPLWMELLPILFFWATSAGFYVAARREKDAEAGLRTAFLVMIGNGALWVAVLGAAFVG